MRRLFTMILLTMVMIGFSIGADAGVKKIRPDQLKVCDSSDDYYQDAQYVYTIGSYVAWTSVVKLPIGKRITKLKYYHFGGNATAETWVHLIRIKMGEKEGITLASHQGYTNNSIIPIENTSAINHQNIKSGYTYYVRASSNNSGARICGIKIVYQD